MSAGLETVRNEMAVKKFSVTLHPLSGIVDLPMISCLHNSAELCMDRAPRWF